MDEKKFDAKKLHKLNNPDRLLDIDSEYIWGKLGVRGSEGLVLVDIGAGTGFFSIPFLKRSGNGKVFACDISDVMLEWMRQNIQPEYPDIMPLKMEEAVVPLENTVAHVVYMINLHHELEDPLELLMESYRILKNDGAIFVVDWKKEDMDQGPPTHLRLLPQQVKNQMLSAGFEDVHIYDGMEKHFLVVARKFEETAGR
ncbi:MAG: class I SAM-dependent methyltransferase [Deltaproteobacteria bacterium]|nr:class I SAM-dependent methyltransferase [Deltaproteobacteria bacterium]